MARVSFAIGMLMLSVASLGMDVTVTSSLSFDEQGAKNRPVSKVITLLKDMLKQLQKEADADAETYDTIACWCVTNEKEKVKAIALAAREVQDLPDPKHLPTEIQTLTARGIRLITELKNLEVEVAKLQGGLDKAKAIRRKEKDEFESEEKDLLESVTALKSAITVLSKHKASLLQVPTTHLLSVAATLQHEISKHGRILEGVLTHKQRRVAAAFVQQPAGFQSYAPQSGQIFGILSQMKETFESNLSASQKDEMAAQTAYEELKAAKEVEIAAASDQIDNKFQELATTDEKNAWTKEENTDTEEVKWTDEEFLAMLREKCQQTDQEHEERTKTRQLEMEACSKALAVLSSDDAHDLFTKTFNAALLQKESASISKRRSHASELLKAVAHKFNSPRLATLAMRVSLDAFTQVKKAIDDMIAQLLQEKQDEIKHKDFCIEELNSNQLQTEKKQRKKSDLEAKIDDLTMTIDSLTKEIDTLNAEIAEMQTQRKRAGENREKENSEFQQTVADQRATQKLLNAALTMLQGFYGKSALMQLHQQPERVGGPKAPTAFKTYKKNSSSGGVIGMIKQIIDDAKAVEAETIRAEEDAQKGYEDFVKDTNKSIEAKSKGIVDRSEVKAKAEANKARADSSLENVKLELEQLANENLDLHSSCDFVLKNFDLRQTARDEEVEALRQAKQILSGAKFQAFLEDMA